MLREAILTTDRELIAAIRLEIKHKGVLVTHDRRAEIEQAITQYEGACLLSRGKNKARAIIWGMKAHDQEQALRKVFETLCGFAYEPVQHKRI